MCRERAPAHPEATSHRQRPSGWCRFHRKSGVRLGDYSAETSGWCGPGSSTSYLSTALSHQEAVIHVSGAALMRLWRSYLGDRAARPGNRPPGRIGSCLGESRRKHDQTHVWNPFARSHIVGPHPKCGGGGRPGLPTNWRAAPLRTHRTEGAQSKSLGAVSRYVSSDDKVYKSQRPDATLGTTGVARI